MPVFYTRSSSVFSVCGHLLSVCSVLLQYSATQRS